MDDKPDFLKAMEDLGNQAVASLQTRMGAKAIDPQSDTVSPGTRLYCFWKVEAGLIPGEPVLEFTRRWMLTSETMERECAMNDEDFKREFPDERSTFVRYREAAQAYAQELTDPRRTNFVRIEWVLI
jgi:hypothetical protein